MVSAAGRINVISGLSEGEMAAYLPKEVKLVGGVENNEMFAIPCDRITELQSEKLVFLGKTPDGEVSGIPSTTARRSSAAWPIPMAGMR